MQRAWALWRARHVRPDLQRCLSAAEEAAQLDQDRVQAHRLIHGQTPKWVPLSLCCACNGTLHLAHPDDCITLAQTVAQRADNETWKGPPDA